MSFLDILLIVVIVIGVIFAILYFLTNKLGKKYSSQQDLLEKSKQLVTIYVIDKKKDKLTNANMPKAVTEQMPKIYKIMKLHLVKAKIGPQILTLICEKNVFEALPVKKNVKVELAGIFISNIPGMKTKKEIKEIKKQTKKEKTKKEK